MNAKRIKRVALYVRVSTDHQSVKNQQIELQAVAERHSWQIVTVFKDQGISGAKGRDQRPGLDKLLQAVARKEFDLVAAWSVDRRPITDRPGRHPAGIPRQGRRSVPASAGARHLHAVRPSDVSDAGRVR